MADGGGIAWLAQSYPDQPTALNSSEARQALSAIRSRKLRLYLEFPASLSTAGSPQPSEVATTMWERVAVATGAPVLGLKPLSLLHPHEIRFINQLCQAPWLMLAVMAGFDTAVDGIPANAACLLGEMTVVNGPDTVQALVAGTALSRFRVGRFGPTKSWQIVWQSILQYVGDLWMKQKKKC